MVLPSAPFTTRADPEVTIQLPEVWALTSRGRQLIRLQAGSPRDSGPVVGRIRSTRRAVVLELLRSSLWLVSAVSGFLLIGFINTSVFTIFFLAGSQRDSSAGGGLFIFGLAFRFQLVLAVVPDHVVSMEIFSFSGSHQLLSWNLIIFRFHTSS
jgi:hypothetical protein